MYIQIYKNVVPFANLPDSYLAIDDSEMGFGNQIPLWNPHKTPQNQYLHITSPTTNYYIS
jgi:hypothetical protein